MYRKRGSGRRLREKAAGDVEEGKESLKMWKKFKRKGWGYGRRLRERLGMWKKIKIKAGDVGKD